MGFFAMAKQGAVDGISPKGKTPLSESVRRAAAELKYTEEKATVILVSDGEETCNLDPCKVGEELEKQGVDFTAHVIGFSLVKQVQQDQLRCLAEKTGGRAARRGPRRRGKERGEEARTGAAHR
jgi:Ca-activated chloride channel family protein